MSKMSKETEQKISQLQMFEQSLHGLLVQKQQLQQQLVEVDSALEELKDTTKAYKIVGNIMVVSEKEPLEKELKDKKEMVELRIKALEKQESKVKEKATEMQQEVMKELKK
ncbi:prefoldin subunit beta [Candidatus Woesearchaeota archaeon]|nr:prefoldin subunit beta [Candidatus Woesearchaeota archaeon]MBW3021445.1 prefoldin subunit beta [Candidatus Woesearchaeota archaeon]